MNILLIGNGFDLAHGLPTKYTDFLLFSKIVLNIIEESHIGHLIPKDDRGYKNWVKKDDEMPLVDGDTIIKIGIVLRSNGISNRDKEICERMIYDYFLFNFSKEKNNQIIVKELSYLIYNNNWIEYFLQCDMHGEENWIDFESEISAIIQSLEDDLYYSLSKQNCYSRVVQINNKFFNDKFTNNVPQYLQANTVEEQEKVRKPEISYKELRDILLADLNKLIRAFEIYLCDYVEKIEVQKKSPDIEGLEIDYILSFNYTHTYSHLYEIGARIEEPDVDPFDYIHGETYISREIEYNNMVLGIDESLPDNRKNTDIEFIAFKKYYQRIFKQTGCKYKNWVREIQRNYCMALQNETNFMNMMKMAYNQKDHEDMWNWYVAAMLNDQNKNIIHNLYIFGHSLDITDRDTLRDLILNDNVRTTIFYPNREELGRKIANLVKVIGQEELVRRTGGKRKTIEFRQQKPMNQ